MAFNDQIEPNIKALRAKIRSWNYKIQELYEGLHECDCEFCDKNNGLSPAAVEKKVDAYKKNQKEAQQSIEGLRTYAKQHKIELSEASMTDEYFER